MRSAGWIVRVGGGMVIVLILATMGLYGAESNPADANLPRTPTLDNAFRAEWLRFGISSGRLVPTGARGINVSTRSEGAQPRERLAIRIGLTDAAIHYELNETDQELVLDISGRRRLVLRRTPKGQASFTAVHYEQPAQGPVVLRIGPGAEQKAYQAPSLWHLLIEHPQVCRQYLLPLVRLLYRQGDLEKTAAEIQTALLVLARERRTPDKERWSRWVAELADPNFATREAADRQLRRAGPIVMPFLEQLEPSRLDAEQQHRIRRIIAALSERPEVGDTPEHVAAWLAGDPGIWLALLAHADESVRPLAAQQLAGLIGEPVDFDPSAGPEIRARQIEQLRSRLEK